MADVDRERKDRAEALRLTLLAVSVELDSFDLLRLAHWVCTGLELPPPLPPPALIESDAPDAARWTDAAMDGMR